jgi:hypothetical protein
MAPVEDGDPGGDHLVLIATQWQVLRHQGPEGAEGVVERLGDERV